MSMRELAELALAQVWQVTLLIIVVCAACRLWAVRRPHLAHVLWLVVLAKCVTPPLWSSSTGLFCWLQPAGETTVSAESTEPDPVHVDNSISSVKRVPASFDAQFAAVSTPLAAVTASQLAEHGGPSGDDRGQMAPLPAQSRPEITRAAGWSLRDGLLFVWLSGTVVSLLVFAGRWMCFALHRRATRQESSAELSRLVSRLASNVGVRRPVRVEVTCGRTGPAVVGLFRPTIVVPDCVMAAGPEEELEPILAHELIHVRRGDLWIAALQMCVRAAWWFHPLVWMATRRVTQEAERACDEEVLAQLRCAPSLYARSLIHVLECKQTLIPAPVFPGLKPVEITSQRLERIMTIGQGCRRRSPWWCRVLLLLLAGTILPGAALVPAATGGAPAETPEELTTRRYRVGPALAYIEEKITLDEDQTARSLLAGLVRNIAGSWSDEADGPKLRWQGKSLRIRQTPAAHARIRDYIDLINQSGLPSIRVHVQTVTAPAELVDALITNWEFVAGDVGDDVAGDIPVTERFGPLQRPLPGAHATPGSSVRMTVEHTRPVRFQLLDQDDCQRILQKLQQDERANIMQWPRATTFSGQSVVMQDTVIRPFVTNVTPLGTAHQPTVRTVSEGLALRARAVAQKGQSVWLDCELLRSDIIGVETAPLNIQEDVHVQVPEIVRTRIETSRRLAHGQTLVIRGLHSRKRTDADQAELLLVSCQPGVSAAPDAIGQITSAAPADPLQSVTYNAPYSSAVRPDTTPQRPETSEPLMALKANRQVVTVIGGVKQPGRFDMPESQPLHVLDAIAMAGGLAATADEKVRILRPVPMQGEGRCVLETNIRDATRDAAGNITLISGDIVTVRSRALAEEELEIAGLPIVEADVANEPDVIDDDFVLAAVAAQLGLAEKPLDEVTRDWSNFRIVKDLTKDTTGKQRFYPMVGPARLQTRHYRCTVYYTENGADRVVKVDLDCSRLLVGKTTRSWADLSKAAERSEPLKLPAATRSQHTGLDRRISLDVSDVPLSTALKELSKLAQLNIVVNARSLQKVGVDTDEPVSLHVENVRARSLLTLMLEPLELEWYADDEVIRISAIGDRPQITRVYPVADLIVPVTGPVVLGTGVNSDAGVSGQLLPSLQPPAASRQTRAEFQPLIELIQQTIEPGSWESVGGAGALRENPTTLSLVIRQSQPVHEQVVDLLSQLRRLMSVQVVLSVRTFDVDAGATAARTLRKEVEMEQHAGAAVIDEDLASEALDYLRSHDSTPIQHPRFTLFNGQEAEVATGGAESDVPWLRLTPVVSADRRSVRLSWTVAKGRPARDTKHRAVTVDAGSTLLIDVTDALHQATIDNSPLLRKLPNTTELFRSPPATGKRRFLFIQPRVIVQEEEEELILQ